MLGGYYSRPWFRVILLHFLHDRSNWSSSASSRTTLQHFPCISVLLSVASAFQHHTKSRPKCSISLVSSLKVQFAGEKSRLLVAYCLCHVNPGFNFMCTCFLICYHYMNKYLTPSRVISKHRRFEETCRVCHSDYRVSSFLRKFALNIHSSALSRRWRHGHCNPRRSRRNMSGIRLLHTEAEYLFYILTFVKGSFLIWGKQWVTSKLVMWKGSRRILRVFNFRLSWPESSPLLHSKSD
jgi:hypothetical protein